jgi:UDP-N-acetylmuramyl pentapeptide phosphotransferase/UDP-N-acetylglucosamine-1-phosphate transferase
MVIGDILTKIFTLTTLGFLTALLATPILTYFLYRYKLGKNIRGDGSTPIFTALHESKKGTPTMGGILIWGTTLFLALVFWVGDRIFGFESFHALNFLTRRETLLPLGAFVGAALVEAFLSELKNSKREKTQNQIFYPPPKKLKPKIKLFPKSKSHP